jgi:DNA-binding MarR family transcriptional regulator
MATKPQLDPLSNSVWRLFITANVKLLNRMGEKFSQAGLPSMEWYDVLLTLKEAPDYRLRLSELADRALLSRSNLTHLVDRMEKAELLYRERCPSDRRGTYAVLSEAGLAMQKKMWRIYSEGIAEYFAAHVDEQEMKFLQRILQQMLAGVEKL